MTKSLTSLERTPASKRTDGTSLGSRANTTNTSSEAPVHDSARFINIRPQAKLTIGQPGDPYEREADQVADRVMRMPAAEAGARAQRMCKECEEELMVQQKPDVGARGGESVASPALERSISSLSGHGQPLGRDTRAFMEPRFGRDFDDVRVHTQERASQAASEMGARAFTLGHDIAFAPGQYAPGSIGGRRLLAHELTHVAQQSGDHVSRNEIRRSTGGQNSGAPKIYGAGRDLDFSLSAVLTHQFVVIRMLGRNASGRLDARVRSYLSKFNIGNLSIVGLGGETMGVTIGGFSDGGNLVAKINNSADIASVKQSAEPQYDGRDYDPELHPVSAGATSNLTLVTKILRAVEAYQKNTRMCPIAYHAIGQNCNTFSQSLLAFVNASSYVSDFEGLEFAGDEPLPSFYFKSGDEAKLREWCAKKRAKDDRESVDRLTPSSL